jgi:hypothetical protein
LLKQTGLFVIDDIEKLRKFLIEAGLPHTDRALFGVKCPYCGKSDRIRELEPPKLLEDALEINVLTEYDDIWSCFAMPGSVLGVCKFCLNPLRISAGAQAVPLTEEGEL